MHGNNSELNQDESNFRSPYYFRETENENEREDSEGESPAGAHESERYVSYLPERLLHENPQLLQ
jgi:hypothetical protein